MPANSAQRIELVESELVGLGAVPCQVEPGRPLVEWPHAVLPAVPRDEVPSGVPNCGYAELSRTSSNTSLRKPWLSAEL